LLLLFHRLSYPYFRWLFYEYISLPQLYWLYCLNCTSKTQCIACIQTAALLSGSCYLCFKHIFACQTCKSTVQSTQCYIGNLVPGGCTTVVGCTQVLQVYTPTLQGVCIDCNSSEFIYNFVQKKYDCKIGQLVGLHCTTIVGCLNTKKINNSIVACTHCNSSLNYQLYNNTCVCAQGYELVNGICEEICGDGLVNSF